MTNPMNVASSRSLALTIEAPAKDSGGVALKNSGYWGIDVRNGTAYNLTWYLRPGSFEGTRDRHVGIPRRQGPGPTRVRGNLPRRSLAATDGEDDGHG